MPETQEDPNPPVKEEITLSNILDAVKELTKTIAGMGITQEKLVETQEALSKQIELSRKAGKF